MMHASCWHMPLMYWDVKQMVGWHLVSLRAIVVATGVNGGALAGGPLLQVVDALLEGTRSKNNRSRVECVEEMGCIVQRHGVGSLKSTGKEKVLPLVAKLVGERDKALRGAALSTLAIVYTSEGDAVWKQLGTLTAPQQSLIEDRFRFTEKEVTRAGGAIGVKREQRLQEREAAAAPPAAASPVKPAPPAAAFASPAPAQQPAAPAVMQSMDFSHQVRRGS